MEEERWIIINIEDVKIEDVNIGDIYYIVNKNHGGGVIKGVIIEISDIHETVLLEGLVPYGSGNCGARVDELYKTKVEAIRSLRNSETKEVWA